MIIQRGTPCLKLLLKTRVFFSQIPKSFLEEFMKPSFAKLDNRSLVVVYGPDTQKLLQGVTTNNVSLLYSNEPTQQPRVALYTMFLNPKGKTITDAIIIRPVELAAQGQRLKDNQLWIDVASDCVNKLTEHLNRYTWKKKVGVSSLRFHQNRPELYAGFTKSIFTIPKQAEGSEKLKKLAGTLLKTETKAKAEKSSDDKDPEYANMVYYDPRGSNLGIRMICGKDSFQYEGNMEKATIEDYERKSRMSGISSSQVMGNKLPFMFNSDIFNGFSFSKGCYLGQQIIARAYFTGIVRRRVFPYILEDSSVKLNEGDILYGQQNVQLGKVLESENGIGTALVQYLPHLDKTWPLKIESPAAGVLNIPFEEQLRDYITDLTNKQSKLREIDL